MRPSIWPYPYWIAHRGAGKLAPENTLAAFRLGASYGYRMFECDAKISRDGTVFLLHDATLERTSNGRGIGGDWDWAHLSLLDAGGWHSRRYAGEPLCSLQGLSRMCLQNNLLLNIEVKPTPGTDYATGQAVAALAARLWEGQPVKPLISSFKPLALEGAQQSAPELPRALLLENWWEGWMNSAAALECAAIVAQYALYDAQSVKAIHQAGMRCLCYTVNQTDHAQALQELGVDGIITDRVDLFAPDHAPGRI